MIIKTSNRTDAIHAIINVWLKDQRRYCNECGETFNPKMPACCEEPCIGRNIDFCKAIVEENKELRKTRLNAFASTKDKTLRWGVRIPPDLYGFLNNYFKQQGEPGLITEKYPVTKFAKNFKMFSIPESI